MIVRVGFVVAASVAAVAVKQLNRKPSKPSKPSGTQSTRVSPFDCIYRFSDFVLFTLKKMAKEVIQNRPCLPTTISMIRV